MQQFSRPTEIEKVFASWMTGKLSKIIQKSKYGTGEAACCNQEKLWQQFHKFVSSKEYKDEWEKFLKQAVSKVDINPLLYQHVADEAFANLLKKEYGEGYDEEEYCSTETTARLTYEEENVVRYIGGYVLRALKKDPSNKDVSNILHKMIDRTPLQECPPSQTWVNSLDRGGLTKITDEAFQLFYAIETVVRQFFKVDKTVCTAISANPELTRSI